MNDQYSFQYVESVHETLNQIILKAEDMLMLMFIDSFIPQITIQTSQNLIDKLLLINYQSPDYHNINSWVDEKEPQNMRLDQWQQKRVKIETKKIEQTQSISSNPSSKLRQQRRLSQLTSQNFNQSLLSQSAVSIKKKSEVKSNIIVNMEKNTQQQFDNVEEALRQAYLQELKVKERKRIFEQEQKQQQKEEKQQYRKIQFNKNAKYTTDFQGKFIMQKKINFDHMIPTHEKVNFNVHLQQINNPLPINTKIMQKIKQKYENKKIENNIEPHHDHSKMIFENINLQEGVTMLQGKEKKEVARLRQTNNITDFYSAMQNPQLTLTKKEYSSIISREQSNQRERNYSNSSQIDIKSFHIDENLSIKLSQKSQNRLKQEKVRKRIYSTLSQGSITLGNKSINDILVKDETRKINKNNSIQQQQKSQLPSLKLTPNDEFTLKILNSKDWGKN